MVGNCDGVCYGTIDNFTLFHSRAAENDGKASESSIYHEYYVENNYV